MSSAPTDVPDPLVTYRDVAAAAERLHGVVRETPVLTARTIDAQVGAEVHFTDV